MAWVHGGYLQCGQRLSTLWVPQLDRLLVVFTAGHNESLLRMPVDTLDIGTVAPKDLLLGTPIKVPHAQRAVVAAGNEFIVRRAETGYHCEGLLLEWSVKNSVQ